MKTMNFRSLVVAFSLSLGAGGVGGTSTPAGFTDNLDEALAEAGRSGKMVYACFSGSDWCGWCKMLEKEVLSKPEFVEGVKDDFVLVYIDSPSNKNLLSDRAKKENPKLVQKYGIPGFPTALLLDAKGEKMATTGYRKGGPEKYAKHLKSLKKNAPEIMALKTQIDDLVKKLEQLEEAD